MQADDRPVTYGADIWFRIARENKLRQTIPARLMERYPVIRRCCLATALLPRRPEDLPACRDRR